MLADRADDIPGAIRHKRKGVRELADVEQGYVWPEQEAIEAWFHAHKQELKEAVTRPRIEAQQRVKELETQRSIAIGALRKLRNLLPEFGGLDGRVWRIIDEALATLEGDEQ